MEYNSLEGWLRIGQATQVMDERAALILTLHAALEHEMEIVLRHLLPRGDRLGPRLGFSQKIDVLAAAWEGDGEMIDMVCRVLVRFNDLRNAVAHGDAREFKKAYDKLMQANLSIGGVPEVDQPLVFVASNVCAALGGAPTMQAVVEEIGKALAEVIHGIKALFETFQAKAKAIAHD